MLNFLYKTFKLILFIVKVVGGQGGPAPLLVQYYSRISRGRYVLDHTEFGLSEEDITGTLPPPDISCTGRRIYFIFKK